MKRLALLAGVALTLLAAGPGFAQALNLSKALTINGVPLVTSNAGADSSVGMGTPTPGVSSTVVFAQGNTFTDAFAAAGIPTTGTLDVSYLFHTDAVSTGAAFAVPGMFAMQTYDQGSDFNILYQGKVLLGLKLDSPTMSGVWSGVTPTFAANDQPQEAGRLIMYSDYVTNLDELFPYASFTVTASDFKPAVSTDNGRFVAGAGNFDGNLSIDFTQSTPEPGVLGMLIGCGVGGSLLFRRRTA